MMANCTPSTSSRPTLPPLHTLNLPLGNMQPLRIHDIYNPYYDLIRQTSRLHLSAKHTHYSTRPGSISSSSSSRTPSPTPSASSSNFSTLSMSTARTSPSPSPISAPSPLSTRPLQKIRLVPTDLESADAVVLVSQKISPNGEPISGETAHLLVGPALQQIRQPNRQLARGARIHPYRIVKGSILSRKPTSQNV